MIKTMAEVSSIVNDVAISSMQFILGAMTLVAALAWNNAFSNYFENNPKLKAYGPWIYASTVTIIAVGVGIAVSQIQKTLEKNGGKNVLNS